MLRKSEEPFLISRQAAFRPSKRLPSLSKQGLRRAGGAFARRPLRGERGSESDVRTYGGGRKEEERRGSQFGADDGSVRHTEEEEGIHQPTPEGVVRLSYFSSFRPLARSTTSLGATDRRADRSTYALRFPPSTYNRVRARRTSLGDFIR